MNMIRKGILLWQMFIYFQQMRRLSLGQIWKKRGTRHNIIIDGGVESNGGDIASIIENIAERNEKVDIFVTHIDGDHIRGLIKGIGISNAEVLKKCVDTIYFNNKKDILDKFRIDSISSEGLEESIKTYIPSGKGYSISEAVSLLEILKKKKLMIKQMDVFLQVETFVQPVLL